MANLGLFEVLNELDSFRKKFWLEWPSCGFVQVQSFMFGSRDDPIACQNCGREGQAFRWPK